MRSHVYHNFLVSFHWNLKQRSFRIGLKIWPSFKINSLDGQDRISSSGILHFQEILNFWIIFNYIQESLSFQHFLCLVSLWWDITARQGHTKYYSFFFNFYFYFNSFLAGDRISYLSALAFISLRFLSSFLFIFFSWHYWWTQKMSNWKKIKKKL